MRRVAILLSALVASFAAACSDDSDRGVVYGGQSGGNGGTGGSGATGGNGWPSGGSGAQPSGGSAGSAAGAGGSAGSSAALTCGELAAQNGWANAACEWNGNDACNGQGVPTDDCDFCCDTASGTGGSAGSGGSGAPGGFGYPVGDKTTDPAGGWHVSQVLAHYWDAYQGRHLAQDVSTGAGVGAMNAPVYSVADGMVRYAKPNTSTYRNVLLIEHDVGDGTRVCSFYGHITPPIVQPGDRVTRGQQVASVLPWSQAVDGGSDSNTHLHYVLLSKALCDYAASSGATSGGSAVCGYDAGGPSSVSDLSNEPYYYTAVADACADHNYVDGFISPSQFIIDHHF